MRPSPLKIPSAEWNGPARIVAPNGRDNDHLGRAVGAGGAVAIVGAPYADFGRNGAGAAYIYTLDPLCDEGGACACAYGADGPECRRRPLCGDDTRLAAEACDDGNVDDGDGCSAGCALEGG